MVVKQFGNVNQNKQVGEKGFNKNLYVGIAIIIGLALVAAFVYSNIPLTKTVTNTGTTADTAVTTMNTGPATSSQNANTVVNGQETGSLLDQVKTALAPGAKIVYGNYGDAGYGPYVCYCTEQDGQLKVDSRSFFTLQEYLNYLERVNEANSGAATSSQNAVANGQENTEGTTSSPIVIDQWYPVVPYGSTDDVNLKLDRAEGVTVAVGISEYGGMGYGWDTTKDRDAYTEKFERQKKHLLVAFNFKVKGDDNIYKLGPYAFGSTGVPGTIQPSNNGWLDAFGGKKVNAADVTWQPVFTVYTEPPTKNPTVVEVK